MIPPPPPPPIREFTEKNITSLELSQSSQYNRMFSPYGGRVKWFKDLFGNVWVKFQTVSSHAEHMSTEEVTPNFLIDHVWPNSRVVEVQYDRSTR